jgi:hypothetical protein
MFLRLGFMEGHVSIVRLHRTQNLDLTPERRDWFHLHLRATFEDLPLSIWLSTAGVRTRNIFVNNQTSAMTCGTEYMMMG